MFCVCPGVSSQSNTCLEFLQETSWSEAWSPLQASFHVKEQLLFSELPLDFRASNCVPKAGHPVREIHLSPFLSGISFIRSLPTACEHRWGLELDWPVKSPHLWTTHQVTWAFGIAIVSQDITLPFKKCPSDFVNCLHRISYGLSNDSQSLISLVFISIFLQKPSLVLLLWCCLPKDTEVSTARPPDYWAALLPMLWDSFSSTTLYHKRHNLVKWLMKWTLNLFLSSNLIVVEFTDDRLVYLDPSYPVRKSGAIFSVYIMQVNIKIHSCDSENFLIGHKLMEE